MGNNSDKDTLKISRLELANNLGLAFFRTIITLNGGAILATLTFLGSASAQSALSIPLQGIKCAMFSFLAGIVSILIALLISYSFTAINTSSSYSIFWDKWIIPTNFMLGLTSMIAFVNGVYQLIAGASATL